MQISKSERPLIAISTGGANNLPRLPELYLQAVENAGAAAEFISPEVDIMDAVRRYAGFIVPGGGDIAPLMYNEERITDLELEDERRVRFDLELFHLAVKQGAPVLGICYGMQLINIAMGGTLYQDIEAQKGGSINHREGGHHMRVDDNPYLAKGLYEVNTSHHQAVKDIAIGLSAFAFATDGVMEAFYALQHRFIMGVQWHPERMNNVISGRVFTAFIEACRDSK